MSRGKYILSKDNYRPKTGKNVPEPFASLNVEILATTQKKNMSHWVLKNMPLEFVVRSNASWYAHNICLTDKELKYLVLSTCPRGPIIIEHSNTIGLNFQISKKYPHSITILENFIKAKMLDVKNKAEILLTSEENTKYPDGGKPRKAFTSGRIVGKDDNKQNLNSQKSMIENSTSLNSDALVPKKRLSAKEFVDQAQPYSKLRLVQEMGHNVGFHFNPRERIVVENNSIDTRPITAKGHNFYSDNKEEQKIITSEQNIKSEARVPVSENFFSFTVFSTGSVFSLGFHGTELVLSGTLASLLIFCSEVITFCSSLLSL